MGRYTDSMLHALAAHQPDVLFSVLVDRKPTGDLTRLPNMKVVHVPPPARHPFLYYVWFQWALPRVLKNLRPDVVFIPEPFTVGGIPSPQIVTVHDLAFWAYPETKDSANRWYYNRFVPKALNRASQIVCISEATAAEVRHYQPSATDRLEIILNGVDEHFMPASFEGISTVQATYGLNEPYFLALSAIEPRKNLVRLLQAFDAAVDDGIPHQLVVAGRLAWKYAPILAARSALRHPDRVRFIGYVPDEMVPALYSGATALLYLSYYEGFGLPVAEAARCGTPALIANCSSLPEVGGKGAYQVDPFSVPAITVGIVRIANDEIFCNQLRKEALLHASTFSWTKAAEQLWDVLKIAKP